MKIVFIVPTYNEKGNIGKLISELEQQFKKINHDMHILVVDDNSPDGTADIVRNIWQEFTNVNLITGEKEGLGAAYIRGMNHCIDVLEADAIFEMDADFSHNPKDVPRMIAALEKGNDLVIGSRYVKGGSIPKEWGIIRKMISLFGNIVARFLAGIYKVRDCTAGFRAIRTDLLRKIDLSTIKAQGYAFQVSLLHRATTEGAQIIEIPVDFIDRTVGESKLGLSDIIEIILVAATIRLQGSATFIKFGMVGASGVIVNLATFQIFLLSGVSKFIASPLAIEASIVWNFMLNNYWTFRWRKTKDRIRIKGLKFNIVSFVSLGISYTTFVALSLTNPEGSPILHQLIGIIPATLVNYFMNSYWTFRHQAD